MNFNWKEYHQLAQWIFDNAGGSRTEEACYRTVISRAYYSAFCTARLFASDVDGKTFENPGAHQKVKNYFKMHSSHDRQTIGTQLDRARDARNYADYNATCYRCDSEKALKVLRSTREVLDLVEHLLD